MKVFVGHDWAEAHHDIHVADPDGNKLAAVKLPEGVEGVARFHQLVADFVDDPADVVIATETDRGLFVGAMTASGYTVIAVNPLSTSRYRQRRSTSGAKSDPGDAQVLSDLARLDAHQHRTVAGDTELAEAIKVLARTHQNLIWTRRRQLNQLRSTLREFYPAAVVAFKVLAHPETLALLSVAPTPTMGRALTRSKIATVLRRSGRQRRITERTEEIYTALRSEQLAAPPLIETAMGSTVTALVGIATELNTQINLLEQQLATHFEMHPDAKIIASLPGLGMILGARVLAEFGDDPNRYVDAKSRKNYAGTSPITRASGKHHVVLARFARNRRLADACYLWAFASLKTSAGAREFYDQHRAQGDTHHRAVRALANRLVGILHGCLRHGTLYDEHTAWAHRQRQAA